MKLLHHSPMFLLLLLMAGCGSMSLENKRVDYKSSTTEAPSLEIPPDLTAHAADDQYAIPQASSEPAKYSDYAKTGAPLSNRAPAVLPESGKAHLKRSGVHRWLAVNESAENIWPLVKGFWMENGFVIKTENPQAGFIETDWAENREKIAKTGLRKILGKVFDKLYDSGEKDMYRTRIERSEDGKGIEIFVTHYGMELVLSPDKTINQWQSRPNDPDLEAAMLQMLMVRLDGGIENQNGAPESVTGTGQESADAPKLQIQPDGSEIVLLAEPFDRSWRKVGIALDHAGFAIDDMDRTKGLYFLHVDAAQEKKGWNRFAFWKRSAESTLLRYQVFVRGKGNYCEVGALNSSGASDVTSQSIVDALFKNVSKP